jgi:hypothetical protein
MTQAYWFEHREWGGFPAQCAAVGDCDLSVLHADDTWHWLVRRDGVDLAEGEADSLIAAQQAAEAAARRRVRLIVWCRDCRHQIEPDPAAMAERYGAELSVPDWHKRLVCGQCGSRQIDFVVTGAN